MSLIEVPLIHHLCYIDDLVIVSDWLEFTEAYLEI